MSASATPPGIPDVTWIKAPSRDVASDNSSVSALVADVLADVRNRGDAAVRDYAAKFDKSDLTVFEVRRRRPAGGVGRA